MAFWNVDLETEDGAKSAAQLGGFACFIAAGLGVLGVGIATMALASTGDRVNAIATLSVGLVEILLFVVAGFRLRAGKGVVWGSVAALVILLEIVMKLVTLTGVGGIVISVILLVGMINGVRGARALGGVELGAEEAAEIFN
jgi:hypothetical protein